MGILIMIAQFFLSLSILIVLHEFGHFAPAKWFNTRVEKFYLFFDPYFSLFKAKIGETEYGIGWLPLGGYVKIAGMVDESMDMEAMAQEPKPWEFRSKPAWQRLIIMLGGVIVNFILGYLIWGSVLAAYGTEFIPAQNVKEGIYVDSLGQDLGLRNGDHILKVGDRVFDRFNPGILRQEISINNAENILVNRDGQEFNVPVDQKWSAILAAHKYRNADLFTARFPWKVGQIEKGSYASKSDLRVDDVILSINGVATPYYMNVSEEIKKNTRDLMAMSIERAGQKMDLNIKCKPGEILGIRPLGIKHFVETEREDYTLGEGLVAGFHKGNNFLLTQIKAFGQMAKGRIKAKDSMGGFRAFAQLFPTEWNWERFWMNTAIISLILGFMNLLPIPALDGGHVMFLLYEMVSGRKPSDTFMQYATIFGFVLVLILLIFANGLDFLRWFRGE